MSGPRVGKTRERGDGSTAIAVAPARQLALIDGFGSPVEPMPAAQRHSPTSVAAADAIKPSAATLRAKVYEYIAEHGPVTDEQIAEGLGLNPSTARPRRIENQRAGLVVQRGEGRTRSGRSAALWVAKKGAG